jgi:hypothetical protein
MVVKIETDEKQILLDALIIYMRELKQKDKLIQLNINCRTDYNEGLNTALLTNSYRNELAIQIFKKINDE